MSTTFTCTTPEDGWALYSHYLANNLLIIRFYQQDEEDPIKKDRAISDAWTRLVGNLYIIMRHMKANGHNEEAAKMQQIIDMVVELDLRDIRNHDRIHNKKRELYQP